MRLTPMRFKSFTWPHNPEVCTVELKRRIAVQRVPYGGCVLQDLGRNFRVMRGEGVFAGEGAYEQFRSLAAVFQESGPGLLVHPVWQTERAYFVSLEMTEKPLPDYVRYSFEFWEDWGGYDGKLTEVPGAAGSGWCGGGTGGAGSSVGTVYAVRKGDTLWGIAKRYGVKLADLIAMNPQIKNPNLIYPGNEVKIP